jgi:hypothetical protein
MKYRVNVSWRDPFSDGSDIDRLPVGVTDI